MTPDGIDDQSLEPRINPSSQQGSPFRARTTARSLKGLANWIVEERVLRESPLERIRKTPSRRRSACPQRRRARAGALRRRPLRQQRADFSPADTAPRRPDFSPGIHETCARGDGGNRTRDEGFAVLGLAVRTRPHMCASCSNRAFSNFRRPSVSIAVRALGGQIGGQTLRAVPRIDALIPTSTGTTICDTVALNALLNGVMEQAVGIGATASPTAPRCVIGCARRGAEMFAMRWGSTRSGLLRRLRARG